MMTAKTRLKTEWDKHAFRKFQDDRTPERRAEDEAYLQRLFAHAEKCPVMQEALDWALSHGIEFVIEHKNYGSTGASYLAGKGVIALTTGLAGVEAVSYITHEIRHAWQDYHKLIPGDSATFEEAYLHIALIEADALAHGLLAEQQYIANYWKKDLPDENTTLWTGFTSWFNDYAQFYGQVVSQTLGAELKIDGCADPFVDAEFNPEPTKIKNVAFINDVAGALQLDRKFNGENYFTPSSVSFLEKSALPAERVSSFYGTITDDQKKLVTEINKRLGAKAR